MVLDKKIVIRFGNLSFTYQRNCSGNRIPANGIPFGKGDANERICKKWK